MGTSEIEKEDYEQVKFIEIGDNNYKIDFILGCDYKMLRILYGQKASNSLDGYVLFNLIKD